MPIPTWVDGNPLPASDLNNWLMVRAAYKTSTETVTSSVTLQNDDDLFVAVDANAAYDVRLILRYQAATAGDIQIGWTAPAGSTHTNTYLHALSTTAVGGGDDVIVAGTTAPGAGGVGSGTDVALIWEGLLITAGTAGTLRLQWAQLASFATGTSVLAGSKLILQRIG